MERMRKVEVEFMLRLNADITIIYELLCSLNIVGHMFE